VARATIHRYVDRYFPLGVRVWVTPTRLVLLWVTRDGRTYSGRCLPFLSQDGDNQLAQVWASIHGGPMKRKDLAKSKSATLHADPDGLSQAFPKLSEFMTAAVFEGSKDRRESPTVTFWATGGSWRASVKDRAEGVVLWLSAPNIGELLAMMEEFVLSAEAPWRHDQEQHERNGKRVKKLT
jgi:hypothetical protein